MKRGRDFVTQCCRLCKRVNPGMISRYKTIVLYFAVIFFFWIGTCYGKPFPFNIRTLDHTKKYFTRRYTIRDFYSKNRKIDLIVDYYLYRMTDREKAAQLLILPVGDNGYSLDRIVEYAEEYRIGGVIFLKNRISDISLYLRKIKGVYKNRWDVKPVFSIDGEPSLIHTRLIGLEPFTPAGDFVDITECRETAYEIGRLLSRIGIEYNFAPVCDFSQNSEIIGNRSFGGDAERIYKFSRAFIEEMRKFNIASTIKHFPGHGTVKGDSHGRLLYAESLPPEVDIFKKLIDYGVVSVMVGHIAVNGEFGTQGRPSTLSKSMVTDFLKGELGFRGIVITDAMTMNAVNGFTDPDIEAVKAGCDIVLMPRDPEGFVNKLTDLMQRDRELRVCVINSVRKILRLKVCLGVIEPKTDN